MTEKYIDLHVHSTYSDGTLSPIELIFLAKKQNLEAIALTDHDTVEGIQEMLSLGNKYDVEIVSGIELSASYKNRVEIHILGFFIDYTSKSLENKLSELQDARTERNLEMLKKLEKLKIHITYEELASEAQGKIITRAHYSTIMLKKGYVQTRGEAFTKYITRGLPAYVEKKLFTPKDCIDTIHKAGGIAVLAHPTLYNMSYLDISNLSKELIIYGLDGIEVMHSSYTKKQEIQIKKIAHSLKLKMTGGSDFHGTNKLGIDLGIGKGNLKIPYSYLENLRTI